MLEVIDNPTNQVVTQLNEQPREQIKCRRCRSLNPAAMSYCRYCHERFSFSSGSSERIGRTENSDDKNDMKNRKLLIAGVGGGVAVMILVTGYLIFK